MYRRYRTRSTRDSARPGARRSHRHGARPVRIRRQDSARALTDHADTLIKHATFAERLWFQRTLGQLTATECDGLLWAHGGFEEGDEETVPGVIAEFERASTRARSIAAGLSLDETRNHPHTGVVVSLRWIYAFMTAEFARHAGHGDILREQLDSMTAPFRDQAVH